MVEQLYQSENLRVLIPDIVKPFDPIQHAFSDDLTRSRDQYGDTFLCLNEEVRQPLAMNDVYPGSNIAFHLVGESREPKTENIKDEGFLLPKRYSSFAKTPFFTMLALEEEGSVLVYRSYWRWSRESNTVFLWLNDFFVEPMIGVDSQKASELCPEAYRKFTSREFLEETERNSVSEDDIWSYLPPEHLLGVLDLSGNKMLPFWKICKDLTKGYRKGELDEVEVFRILHETSSNVSVEDQNGEMERERKYSFWQAVGAAITETELLSAAVDVGDREKMSLREFGLIRPSYRRTREIKERAIEYLRLRES